MMSESPLVSIIIPAFNQEHYLQKCLDSILHQTYENLQIIVVDDGSTDASPTMLDDYEAQYRNILKVIHQDNAGVAAARNCGVREAHGEYLTFVDSDDYVAPDYIETMLRTAIEADADLVITGYISVDRRGRLRKNIPGSYIAGRKEEYAYRYASAWGRLYRASFWDEHGIAFPEDRNARGEDAPVAIYSNVMAHNIQVVPYAGYYYVSHGDSAMGSMRQGKWFGFPHEGIRTMHRAVQERGCENDMEAYQLGLLKLFAMYRYVIYRRAPLEERQRLLETWQALFPAEQEQVLRKMWKHRRWSIQYTLLQKGAMQLFLWKR